MPGMPRRGMPEDNPGIAPKPFQQYGDPASFTAGATTQAGDYDTIMKNYQDVINQSKNNPLISTDVTPQLSGYKQSGDVTKSLVDLSNLATTGGYSEADKQDIRARDISPTRSIYANAQQNVDRSRALGGGYSPNANATQAQMARDESQQVSDINTNANAGIAQNVAANEIAASGAYGSEALAANSAQQNAGQFDASATNTANTGNANRSLEAQIFGRNQITGAISGQRDLYGTTPALTNTFGNQVSDATRLSQNQQNINNQTQRNIFGAAGGY